MAKPTFLSKSPYSLSLTPLEAGDFLVVSKTRGKREDLLFAGLCNPRRSLSALSDEVLSLVNEYSSLDAVSVRSTLNVEQKQAMTWHLLQVHSNLRPIIQSPRETTAWRYNSLLAWGESAAAKVMAEEDGVPVRTMHSRLRLARDKGFLDSPGSGARLGND